jgi:hypothetical protein
MTLPFDPFLMLDQQMNKLEIRHLQRGYPKVDLRAWFCVALHGPAGNAILGPSWKGVWN